MNTHTHEPYELLCVGFGPAGIALAAAIEDAITDGALPSEMRDKVVFLEKAPGTEWQGGLLLPGTNINHSEYRDLATPRDPGSQFTFARFLKASGNLYNRGAWSGAVGRIEWSKYVGWAAEKLSHLVRYNEPVEAIEAVPGSSGQLLSVRSTRGTYLTRQVVVACGMEAYTPAEFRGAPKNLVRHADPYLYYRDELDAQVDAKCDGPFRMAIIGSGLSAAEIMHDMLERHAPAKIDITSIHRGLAFRHYDMSQFSNTIFMPHEVDRYAGADAQTRRQIADTTFSTNFAGVDAECADAEWNFLYERKLMGIENARILDRHALADVQISQNGVDIALHDRMTGTITDPVSADVVILATGYRDTAPERLLKGLSGCITREFDGLMSIGRDYRLATTSEITAPIWLNGHCEHTHGVADTQSFSLVAYKAEQLMQSIFFPPNQQEKESLPNKVSRPERELADA